MEMENAFWLPISMNVIFMKAEDQRSLKSGLKIVQPARTFEWLKNQRES
jgi:hypothetical protein